MNEYSRGPSVCTVCKGDLDGNRSHCPDCVQKSIINRYDQSLNEDGTEKQSASPDVLQDKIDILEKKLEKAEKDLSTWKMMQRVTEEKLNQYIDKFEQAQHCPGCHGDHAPNF